MDITDHKAKERRYRVEVVLSSIKTANELGKVISEEKLILEIIDKFGVSVRTAKTYLNELELRNSIVRYAGEVWSRDYWDEAGDILTKNRTLRDTEQDLMLDERKQRFKEEDSTLK